MERLSRALNQASGERRLEVRVAGGVLRHVRSLPTEIDDHVPGSHDRVSLSHRISYGVVSVSDHDTAVVLTRLIINTVDVPIDGSGVNLVSPDREHRNRFAAIVWGGLGTELLGSDSTWQ